MHQANRTVLDLESISGIVENVFDLALILPGALSMISNFRQA